MVFCLSLYVTKKMKNIPVDTLDSFPVQLAGFMNP